MEDAGLVWLVDEIVDWYLIDQRADITLVNWLRNESDQLLDRVFVQGVARSLSLSLVSVAIRVAHSFSKGGSFGRELSALWSAWSERLVSLGLAKLVSLNQDNAASSCGRSGGRPATRGEAASKTPSIPFTTSLIREMLTSRLMAPCFTTLAEVLTSKWPSK